MITAKNIASFRACKRLIDAGIVLKTNVRWRVNHKDNNYPPSCLAEEGECHSEASLPAPSLGELWTLIPPKLVINRDLYYLEIEKHSNGQITVFYRSDKKAPIWTRNANLADALVNLIVYLKIMRIDRLSGI